MKKKIDMMLGALYDWWVYSSLAFALKVSLICGSVTGILVGGLGALVFKLATRA